MANWPFSFRPLPGRFGNMLEFLDVAIGTGGTTVADSATTTVVIPTPNTKSYVDRLSIAASTAAASAGTVTVRVFKQSGATKTFLMAATSIKSDVVTAATPATYALTITGTDAERLLQPGDCLGCDVVASGTVTTQPVLYVTAAMSVIS